MFIRLTLINWANTEIIGQLLVNPSDIESITEYKGRIYSGSTITMSAVITGFDNDAPYPFQESYDVYESVDEIAALIEKRLKIKINKPNTQQTSNAQKQTSNEVKLDISQEKNIPLPKGIPRRKR